MAERSGCRATFEEETAYAGVDSAGRCQVDGSWVQFRVLPSVSSAYAWLDGAKQIPDRTAVVGNGWVSVSASKAAMAKVIPLLTVPHE